MLFTVSQTHAVASSPPGRAYLIIDRWDDWFRFETLFQLVWVDGDGIHRVGDVKIGQVGQVGGQPGEAGRRPALPPEFDALGPEFFSVGQDDSYYENLARLGPSVRDRILICLRDIARSPEILAAVESEKVLDDSLLRTVSLATVRGQFRRMAEGGVRLTPYSFVITRVGQEMDLAFDVTPDSRPPTNIHVIIGRGSVNELCSQFVKILVPNAGSVLISWVRRGRIGLLRRGRLQADIGVADPTLWWFERAERVKRTEGDCYDVGEQVGGQVDAMSLKGHSRVIAGAQERLRHAAQKPWPHRVEMPHRQGKPTRGFEPRTPSLRVKCSTN